MAGRVIYKTVTKGLVLYIDAGNPKSYVSGSTIVTDLVGTQNGTLTNGVGYSSTAGGCFTFDGANDYIDFGINTKIQPTAARTISMWIFVDSSNLVGVFYSDGNFYTDRNGITMWIDTGGYRTEITNASAYQLLQHTGYIGGTPNMRGSWYYMTVSFNGTTAKSYFNGTLINTYAQTIIPTNGVYPTILGTANGGSTWWLKGNISQCKIYNTQLSDAEVLQNYNATKNRYI